MAELTTGIERVPTGIVELTTGINQIAYRHSRCLEVFNSGFKTVSHRLA